MAKRSYSDKDKASALTALAANGGNVLKTSQQLNIPRKTLTNWANEKFVNEFVAEICHEKKGALADELEKLAYECVGVAPQFLRSPFTKLSEVATTLGIAIDKMRLLRNEPTAITESKSSDREWAEKQIAEIMKEFELSRDEAIELAKTHAPTIAEWVM